MAGKLGLRSIEIIIAASVVVISVASLCVAVYQGMVMERTMKASVWPLVQFGHGNANDDTHAAEISFTIYNEGIGPAHIQTVELWWAGQRVQGIEDFLTRCCAGTDDPEQARAALRDVFSEQTYGYVTAPIQDVIISAGDEISFFIFPGPEDPAMNAVWTRADQARWDFSVRACYCSVFEDCWLLDSQSRTREPVNRCEIPARD